MTPEEFRRIAEIFDEARRLPPSGRTRFLDESCGPPGSDRRDRLEALLAEHEEVAGGLGLGADRSTLPVGDGEGSLPGIEPPRPPELEPGVVVEGKYRLLGLLGEGGLGVVYLAEQVRPVKRRVALKVIKLGMDTRRMVARFDLERNSLTLMDHPGIARLYDAGVTERGRPYFVMEHIPGVPITRFCDAERLTTAERLGVFLDVCAAVEHAHRKGIIHRDLKPSNILVTLRDGKPAPKIIDFGIAKATAQHLTERTVFTELGQVIGTPEYMSPEQVETGGLEVDSTTDVYSLGVVLYELLTGVLPFELEPLRRLGFPEIQRVLREKEPVRPSSRVTVLGDLLGGVVERRRTDPRALRRDLRGDLDWIVLKAMEKQRSRRYGSVGELAADIRRHLDHLPVSAGPPGASYRLRKFARRHRSLLISSALVLAALVAGLAGTIRNLLEARSQRDIAVAASAESVLARDAAREALRKEALEREKAEAALERAEVGMYYSQIAQAGLDYRLHDIARARLDLARCEPPPGRPDRRGWEWRYLRDLVHSAWLPLEQEAPVVDAIAFGAGGSLVAAGGGMPSFVQFTGKEPGQLRVWNSSEGRILLDLGGRSLRVMGLAFSPAGDRLAVGSCEGKWCGDPVIRVWDLATGSAGPELKVGDGRRGVALRFGPDGSSLLSASLDGVTRWDLSRGAAAFTLPDQVAPAFGDEGRTIITCGRDGTLNRWAADTGERIETIRGFPPEPFQAAIGPDGRLVASVAGDQERIAILDAATAAPRHTLQGHRGEVLALAFSPDGRLLASCGADATVRLWDLRTGGEEMLLLGHTDRVSCLAFSPGGERLATGGWFDTVDIWDLTRPLDRTVLRAIFDHDFSDGSVESIAFGGDGSVVTIHRPGGRIRRWDRSSGALLSARRTGIGGVVAIPARKAALSAGALRAAGVTGDDPRSIEVRDAATGISLRVLGGHTWPVTWLALATGGRRLASAASSPPKAGEEGRSELKVRDVEAGSEVLAAALDGVVLSLAMDPAGILVAAGVGRRIPTAAETGGAGPLLWIRDVAAGREIPCPARGMPATAAAFSASGRLLAAIGDDGVLTILPVLGKEGSREIGEGLRRECPGPVDDLAFSPDDRRLAGASRDGVTVWDPATGQEVITLRGRPRIGYDPPFNPRVAFGADGASLAASAWDGSVSIWTAPETVLDDEVHRTRPAAAAVFAWRLREAVACAKAGNPAGLEFHLARLARTEPPGRPLRIDRARVLALAGRRDEALADLDEAVRQDPADPEAHEERGKALVLQGRWTDAAGDFDRAVRLDSRPPIEAWYGHLLLLLDRGDWEGYRRGLAALEERGGPTIEEPPAIRPLIGALGPAESDDDDRIRDLEALAARTKLGDAGAALAATLLRAGKHERILERRAGEADPATPACAGGECLPDLLVTAIALERLGRPDEARRLLDGARRWGGGALTAIAREPAPAPAGVGWKLWLLLRLLGRQADSLISK